MMFSLYFNDVVAFQRGSSSDAGCFAASVCLSADGIKEHMTKCHDALQGLYEAIRCLANTYSKWEHTNDGD